VPCRATGTALPDTPVIGDQGSPDYNSIVTISSQLDAEGRSGCWGECGIRNVEFEMGCPPGAGIRNSDFHDPKMVDWPRYAHAGNFRMVTGEHLH